jgi:uncharacterized protein
MADDAYQGNGASGARRLNEPSPGQAAAREELAQRLERIVRVSLRPMASPMPMGFVGLAAATTVLASLNLGWIATSEAHTVAIVMIAFVFPLQGSASIFGILTRDGVAATAMAILSGTWLTVGLVTLTSPAGSTSDALGVFLIIASISMLLPALGAALGKLVPAVVLFTASLRFASSAISQLTGSDSWQTITGWVGILLGILALYAALASLLENVQGRTVLPLGRRQKGRMASEGGLTEQVIDVTHEPGVRAQL